MQQVFVRDNRDDDAFPPPRPQERELGLAKTRVIAALRTTAAKRSETDAEVEGFKVQCMQRERARREVEEHRRQDLRAKMLDEAEASAKVRGGVV